MIGRTSLAEFYGLFIMSVYKYSLTLELPDNQLLEEYTYFFEIKEANSVILKYKSLELLRKRTYFP